MPSPFARDALVPHQTPELTGINRLSGRATLLPYASAEDARADRDALRVVLDGTWRFTLVDRPEATPEGFADAGFDDAGWADLPVPACWTLHGFDRPHYTNWRLPFTPVDSPKVPAANPTGLYRTTFTLPKGWAGRRVVLSFGGVEAGGYGVWVNGVPVGMGKDSRLPSEFDVTAAVKPGRNLLAVQAVKWADTTYIEDQDHWRQYGITRSVTLSATGPAFIEDLFCRASFDPRTGGGRFEADLRLGGAGAAGWRFRVELFDARGKAALRKPLEAEIPWGLEGHKRVREPIGEVAADLRKVSPWSHETPALYKVVATLLDPEGREVEATRTRVGFRTVEIRDRELRLNGKMVYIKGVNRHDHHDVTGKVIDRETMLADLRAMKAHHINAVRCSHYPNDPAFLDLCDELGFLVVDETNLEAHHTYARTPHDPRYALAFLDRAMRMVLRDRNHPCVIAWSLGNESGYGPNQDAMAGWIRHADPTRPLHCEGAICKANSDWDRGHAATDIICPMYPSIESLVEWAKTTRDPRPMIPCEYSHAMGNSNGSLADTWEAFETHHGLQGGFIWEWIDHGLRRTDAEGREYWAYGGDFGDEPNDADFVCDGLVWPDRTPHPAMAEVKRLFQPLGAELAGVSRRAVKVKVRSKLDFLDTGHLDGRWTLRVDGVAVEQGRIPRLSLAPGRSRSLKLPARMPEDAAGRELHLDLAWTDRRDQPLVGRNQASVFVQLALPVRPAALAPAPRPGPSAQTGIRELKDAVVLAAGDSEVVVDRRSGEVRTWTVAGVPVLTGGPETTLWRAPTENDGVRAWHFHRDEARHRTSNKILGKWMLWGLDELTRVCGDVTVTSRRDGAAAIEARLRIWGRQEADAVTESRILAVRPDGSLAFEHRFEVPEALADLPRLGVALACAPGFDALRWFGHGPGESYSDRCLGTPLGIYACAVRDRYVPYIMPQEHGNIHRLRWLTLARPDGLTLTVRPDRPCDGKATQVSDATLTTARHTTDVAFDDRTTIHLDVAQRGLGTGSCGPDTLTKYRLKPARHRLRYTLAVAGGR